MKSFFLRSPLVLNAKKRGMFFSDLSTKNIPNVGVNPKAQLFETLGAPSAGHCDLFRLSSSILRDTEVIAINIFFIRNATSLQVIASPEHSLTQKTLPGSFKKQILSLAICAFFKL